MRRSLFYKFVLLFCISISAVKWTQAAPEYSYPFTLGIPFQNLSLQNSLEAYAEIHGDRGLRIALRFLLPNSGIEEVQGNGYPVDLSRRKTGVFPALSPEQQSELEEAYFQYKKRAFELNKLDPWRSPGTAGVVMRKFESHFVAHLWLHYYLHQRLNRSCPKTIHEYFVNVRSDLIEYNQKLEEAGIQSFFEKKLSDLLKEKHLRRAYTLTSIKIHFLGSGFRHLRSEHLDFFFGKDAQMHQVFTHLFFRQFMVELRYYLEEQMGSLISQKNLKEAKVRLFEVQKFWDQLSQNLTNQIQNTGYNAVPTYESNLEYLYSGEDVTSWLAKTLKESEAKLMTPIPDLFSNKGYYMSASERVELRDLRLFQLLASRHPKKVKWDDYRHILQRLFIHSLLEGESISIYSSVLPTEYAVKFRDPIFDLFESEIRKIRSEETRNTHLKNIERFLSEVQPSWLQPIERYRFLTRLKRFKSREWLSHPIGAKDCGSSLETPESPDAGSSS